MGVHGKGSREWWVLGVVVVALALPVSFLPERRPVEDWIRELRRGDATQRMTAAHALRHSEPEHVERSLRALLTLTRSAEPRLRWVARESARLLAATDIGLVVDLLAETSPDDTAVRELCEGVLLNHPEEAVKPLAELVGDPEARGRRPAAGLLARIGRPAVQPLIRLLWVEDQDTRLLAAWALGSMHEPALGVLGLLATRRSAPDELERRTALRAMQRIAPRHPKTREFARDLLEADDLETRRAALLAYFEGWLSRLEVNRAGVNAQVREALGEVFEANLERLLDDFAARTANGVRPPD